MKRTHTRVALLIALVSLGCSEKKSRTSGDATAAPVASEDPTAAGLSLTSARPDRGSSLGGTSVLLVGIGFQPGAQVRFGGVAATDVQVLTPTELRCTTPARAAGTVDVVLLSADGAQAPLNNGFTFESAGPLARVADYGDPSGAEQELLELANRARRDPVAEGRRLGLDFSAYRPAPPLTHNQFLGRAALGHTLDMARRAFYGHVNPDGLNANGRVLNSGYDLHRRYGLDPRVNRTENIGAGAGNLFNTPQSVHDTFLIDRGLNPPKHRQMLLGAGPFAGNREIGIGFRIQLPSAQRLEHFVSEELARTQADRPFLTGVVFDDRSRDGIARAGEGQAGVRVVLSHASGFSLATTTASAGGYAFEVLVPTTFTLTIAGQSTPVTVGGDNVKVDARDRRLLRR